MLKGHSIFIFKMGKMKSIKLFIVLLALLGYVSSVNAAKFTVDNITYETLADEVTVKVSGFSFSLKDVVIPSTVTYKNVEYSVVEIGKSALWGAKFANNTWYYSSMRTLTISEGVKTISASGIGYNQSLKEVYLPQSLVYIGEKAFYECSQIETIVIPDNVNYLGAFAFQYCKKLKEITIPDKITEIHESTFQFDDALETVTLHENITRIEKSAFSDCSNLNNLNYEINENLTYLGNQAFMSVPGIKQAVIHGDIEYFGNAFTHCHNLEYVWMKEGITSIQGSTFMDCWHLKYVVIPSTVVEIGLGAFGENEVLGPGQHDDREYYFLSDEPLELKVTMDGLTHVFGVLRPNDRFYVKESALSKYRKEWNYGDRIDYKIPLRSKILYSTEFREFDSDFHAAIEESNIKPFVATAFNETKAYLTSIDNGIVPKECGFVIRNKTGNSSWFQISETQDNEQPSLNYLKGVCWYHNISPTEEDGSVNYVLYNGEFCTFDNTGQLSDHKAYLQLPASAGSKQITMSFADEPSGIGEVEAEEEQKVYYNLSGMRVEKPKKGVYVQNGKKIIFK